MTGNVSKYALIGGKEVTLLESISHASSGEVVCVFEDGSGAHHFVSEREWDAGAEEFARYASERRLVTSESPSRDKIALFRSLFKGRDDVYGHGFTKRDGSIGYSPACANERTRRCPRYTKSKPGAKCADCPNREFIPVNERAIRDHFKGERDDLRDVMGLYVLTPDCKTWVLIADFDKEGWQRETALYRDACRAFGLSPAVERSRSGNGSHVWLFFEDPIDAELARNLGCALITHAMTQASGMSFESYDRFFPTQSTIPEGGFGNLIALPFQGRPQRQSNSVFIDDGFSPYPDQWRFLSSVSKVTLQQVREIVDSSVDGPLALAAFAFVTAYWCVLTAIIVAIHIGIYGVSGWNLPLQVALGFDNPYPMTIGQAILASYALGYLVALGMAALTLLLSAKLRSTMPVAAIAMAIVFLGIVIMFSTPLAKVALLTPFSGLSYALDSMVSYVFGPLVVDLPTALAALYVAMLVVFTPLAIQAFRRHQVA